MAPANTHLGEFSDEYKEWLTHVDIAAMEEARKHLTVADRRENFELAEDAILDPFPGIGYNDYPINPDGVLARVFTKRSPSATDEKPRPLAMVFHGGGFEVGGVNSEMGMINVLAGRLECIVVSVGYRLAPENPFPVPLDDCYAGLEWARENAQKLHANPDLVLVGGSSAGANLSAAVALKARYAGLTCIKGQILVTPTLCDARHLPKVKYELESLDTVKSLPFGTKQAITEMWASYSPDGHANPLISPLIAESHENLPPAYIQVAGADTVRDEGIAYAKALKDANVEVKLDIYPGLPHGFNVRSLRFPSCAKSEDDLEKNVRELLADY